MAKVPYVLLALGVALIYIPRLIVLRASVLMPGGLDNNNPRDQQARLEGWGRRANAAHHNSIEAFPPFAAGVLASLYAKVDLNVIVALGSAFIVLRTIYIAMYVGDKASARTAVWSLGMLATGGLLLAPVFFVAVFLVAMCMSPWKRVRWLWLPSSGGGNHPPRRPVDV